jgi:hypothetical protein
MKNCKHILTALVVLILGTSAQAQNFSYDWHTQVPSMNNGFYGYGSVQYSEVLNDTLYAFYQFYGDSIDVDPGAGVELIDDDYAAGLSAMVYVSRYVASTGAYISSSKLIEVAADANGGMTVLNLYDFDVASTGALVVTGGVVSAVDFDGSTNSSNWYSPENAGSFVAFYNSNGSYDGHIEYGLAFSGTPWSSGITDGFFVYRSKVDESGNVYITGQILGTTDLDFSAGVDTHTSAGNYDCALVKINGPSSSYEWGKSFGNVNGDYVEFMEISGSDVVLAGYFAGPTLDLDPNAGTFDVTNSMTCCDQIFLSRIDANGNFLAGGALTPDVEPTIYRMIADNDGTIHLFGYLDNPASLDMDLTSGVTMLHPQYLGFLVKYAEDFSAEQLYSFDDASNLEHLAVSENVMALGGTLYAYDTIWVHSSIDNSVVPIASQYDAITVIPFHTSAGVMGEPVYYNFLYNRDMYIGSMAADETDGIYHAGVFRNAMDFDPFNPVDNPDTCTYTSPVSILDNYVTKFNWEGFVSVPTLTDDLSMRTFPNPTNSNVMIEVGEAAEEFAVYGMNGQKLMSGNLNGAKAFTLDFSVLDPGVYQLLVRTTKGMKPQRIVKVQ